MDYLFSLQTLATVLATNLLILLIWALSFAWLGGLRDDDGRWNGRLFTSRVQVHLDGLKDAASDLHMSSIGVILVAIGSCVLAARNICVVAGTTFDTVALSAALDERLLFLGTGSFLAGVLLLLRPFFGGVVARWRERRPSPAQELATRTAAASLPPIVDMATTDSAAFSGEDPLQITLRALSNWKRSRRYGCEGDYQEALERHFRRHARNLTCKREHAVSAHRSGGRADFVLGSLVLVEVKRGFSKKTEKDRAIGQLYDYGQTWRNKPKVLVLFEATHDDVFKSLATEQLINLHRQADLITVRM